MSTGHGFPHDLSKTSVWLHGYGAAHEAAYQASYQMWNAHSNIHEFKPTIVNCKSGVIVLFCYGVVLSTARAVWDAITGKEVGGNETEISLCVQGPAKADLEEVEL